MSLPLSSARTPMLPFAAQAPKMPQNSAVSGSAAGTGEADKTKADDDIRQAAESFEAIILRQLLASMRKAKLSEDVFGSSATDNFREMADARTADSLANMRQFGIADMVERELRGQGGGVGGVSSGNSVAAKLSGTGQRGVE